MWHDFEFRAKALTVKNDNTFAICEMNQIPFYFYLFIYFFNSERTAVEFACAWVQFRLFQTTALCCPLSLFSSAVNFDHTAWEISLENRWAMVLRGNTYQLLKLSFMADCMMMHFLKLYIFFHKYIYHLEFIEVFLNQYGKGKCISES